MLADISGNVVSLVVVAQADNKQYYLRNCCSVFYPSSEHNQKSDIIHLREKYIILLTIRCDIFFQNGILKKKHVFVK